MAKSGVIEEITAHRALEGLPGVWADLAHGRIGRAEALAGARLLEPEELVERTARMLTPPTAAESKARLEVLLGRLVAEPQAKPRARRWIPGGVAVLAAAAAVLLVLVVPRERSFDAGYELGLDGALVLQRDVDPGPTDELPRFRIDRPVSWTIRPAHRVTEAIDVRAFAKLAEGHEIPLRITRKITSSGVVEISGTPRAWGLEPGPWQLTFVVGPPDELPDEPSSVRLDAEAPYDVDQGWIQVLPAAPPEGS
jgi:hypothetical protein